ncbi:MAG: 16S rRNA (uracil(1498)-N(3))-methyltransferase [Planctomycetales bacterium]|nr:16S rRNA (uracil(1498)-N(3))-methyltransferase [Planctomycetales bacterium]
MAHRFFSDTPITSKEIVLGESEARHLAQVMRKQSGEQVIVFDGSGVDFLATIQTVDRKTVELIVDQRLEINRELPFDMVLAVALPKGDRQTWMVQKLVELGATRLVPLVSERGVAQPTGKAIERLKRHVIEASKQCERNVLMDISPPVTIEGLGEQVPATFRRYVAHVTSKPNFGQPTPQNVAFAVGPEGGFTDNEVDFLANSGWTELHLGQRILRVETAAMSLASWWGISHCMNG